MSEVNTTNIPAEKLVRVTFEPEGKAVEFEYGTMPYEHHGKPMSFLDVAENFNIFLDHACGGVCACTTCHLWIKDQQGISPPDDDELDRLDMAADQQLNSRLGCQAVITGPGNYVVEIPKWNRNYVSEGKPLALADKQAHRDGGPCMSSSIIERKPLLATALGNRNVTTVDVREITLGASQKTGRHLHPCAVVGYIAKGTAVLQIEGELVQTLPAGSAFYEPANQIIAEFSNASDTAPLTFVAFYLIDGEQELITMLESR